MFNYLLNPILQFFVPFGQRGVVGLIGAFFCDLSLLILVNSLMKIYMFLHVTIFVGHSADI